MRYATHKIVSALAIAGLAVAAPGCWWVTTKSEGNKLQTQVEDLDERLSVREDQLETKIQQLQKVLDEATAILKRNSADLGAEVDSMSNEVRQMRGLLTAAKRYVDEAQRDIESLKKAREERGAAIDERLAAIEKRLAELEKTPQNPDQLYNDGKAAYDRGEYPRARALFRQLVTAFPGHDKAATAQYLRAESYYKEKAYDDAIREYQKVFDKYAKSSLADEALFKAGEAALELKHCTEARAYFGLLRQRYKRSKYARRAKQKDTWIKRNAKNKSRCVN